MQPIQLSRYGSASTTPSPVNRMMAAFAQDFREGVDINLGVGYVSEETIPHQWIREALDQVIADPRKHKAPFNYGGPAGSANLIAALKRFYIDHAIGGFDRQRLDAKRIVIGVSGATSLLESIAQVLRPGIVIATDPIYYIYSDLLQRAGFEVLAVPEDEQGIDTDALRVKLDGLGPRKDQISFAYIVTVSNPTCTILSDARRQDLMAVMSQLSSELDRKVPVFFDAAYELLIHDPAAGKPKSALLHDALGIAYELGTLSKVLAPALRIGYMIGPDEPFVDAVVQNISDIGFSAPLAAQEIAAQVLDGHVMEQLSNVNDGYRHKAAVVGQWIEQYLGDFLQESRGGQAGFYFYLTFKEIETHEASPLFERLTVQGDAPRVIYIPGEYCVHPTGDMVDIGRKQMRISYGFETLDQIETALKLIASACRDINCAAG